MLIVKSKIRKDYPAHGIEIIVGVNGFEELPEAVLVDLKALGAEVLDVTPGVSQPEPEPAPEPAPVSRKRKT